MIFEYSEATRQAFKENKQTYDEKQQELVKRILDDNARLPDGKEKTRKREAIQKELDEISAIYLDNIAAIYDAADKEYFDSFNGDAPALLDEAKRQIPLIIESLKNFDIESANGEPLTENNKKTRPKRITTVTARKQIKAQLKLIFVFFEDYPEQGNALNEFIADYLGDGKYIKTHPEGLTHRNPQALQIISDKTDLPVDKINRKLWSLLEDTHGQMKFNVANASDQKNGKSVYILLSLDFEEIEGLKITKKLTPFDKRVYCAIGALYDLLNPNGALANVEISYKQIYRQMNDGGNAGASDIKKIRNSVLKMFSANVFLSNKDETAKGYNYPQRTGYAHLLDIKGQDIGENGEIDSSIILLQYPALLNFARERKQITTVYTRLLKTPLSNTNANINLTDYFIEEISRIKNGDRNHKMLYETIYNETGITTKKQKQRAPGKIKTLLQFYKAEGFITDFKTDDDGVTINPEKKAKRKA